MNLIYDSTLQTISEYEFAHLNNMSFDDKSTLLTLSLKHYSILC